MPPSPPAPRRLLPAAMLLLAGILGMVLVPAAILTRSFGRIAALSNPQPADLESAVGTALAAAVPGAGVAVLGLFRLVRALRSRD